MTTALEIQLAPMWRAIRARSSDCVAALYADLDVRAIPSMLALALEQSLGGDVVALVLPNRRALDIAKWRLGEWMPELKPTRIGDAIGFEKLWLTLNVTDLPVEPKQVFVVDAHLLESQPPGATFIAGSAVPHGHWFSQYMVDAMRFDATKCVESFPDQASRVTNDALRMRLVEERTPFVIRSFISKRLYVRSDKGPEFLNAEQQAQAAAQLGEGWSSGRNGTPIVSFALSPIQKRYLAIKRYARSKGYNKFLLLKYRRGGFTTLEQAQSYGLVSSAPRSQVITLAHTRESTARIFRIAKTFHEQDPTAITSIGDAASSIELANGSLFFIGTAGGKGVSRGDTLARAHGSEVSRWCQGPRQMSQVADLVAGLCGAASHGEVVLETTPLGVEWFCQTYRDAKRGLNNYFPIFLRWFDDPSNVAPEGTYSVAEIRDTLSEEELMLIARHKLSFAQIAFRRTIIKDYKHLAAQEYPEDDEKCFLSSGTCFFDVAVVAARYSELNVAPIGTRSQVPGGWLTIFEPPQAGVKYVMGCDTSEGIPGCDPNGVGVMRRDTGAQVASLHGYFKPSSLAKHAVELGMRYNKALLGVERENHGHAVLEALKPYSFYNTPHYRGGGLYYYAQDRAGWTTSESTRPRMLDTLSDLIVADPKLFVDHEFLMEALSFKQQPSGKFEADPGAHDDSVMKWAIAAQMRLVPTFTSGLTILQGTL